MPNRIFLTSSHLSSIMAALIADSVSANGDRNYLLIDNYYKKEALLQLIKSTKGIYNWAGIIDCSIPLANEADLKPGARKTLVRKVKSLPLLKQVYAALLKRHNTKYALAKSEELKQVLAKHGIQHCDELFVLTQTALNAPLFALFPNATRNYYEHGLGDYYYCWQQGLSGNFYGLFGTELAFFLRGKNSSALVAYAVNNNAKIHEALLKAVNVQSTLIPTLKGRQCALFLMDALEGYNPPASFWTDYVKRGIEEMRLQADTLVLVKPHPNQSNAVLQITEDCFRQSGVDFLMLNEAVYVSVSAEILFAHLRQEIRCIVSTFSSSVFYLSKIYPDAPCDFVLMSGFVEPYLQNGPKQYLDHYKGLKPLIKEVFWSDKIRVV